VTQNADDAVLRRYSSAERLPSPLIGRYQYDFLTFRHGAYVFDHPVDDDSDGRKVKSHQLPAPGNLSLHCCYLALSVQLALGSLSETVFLTRQTLVS